ncbi:MAG: hypothetical protein K2M73_08620 [Lachnospiraceae bacterium]|nr:hypothetical protein [Lachnospiraceae bacterium]
MKKKTIIWIFSIVFLLIIIYGIGYKVGLSLQSQNIVYKEQVYESNPVVYNSESNQNVADVDSIIVTSNMDLVLESYDTDTESLTTTTRSMPVQLLGMDRESIIEYIKNNNKIFIDGNEKIENLMLVSFDKEKVVIRKSVSIIKEESTTEEIEVYKYYVTLQENSIIVYKEDKTSIFLETAINTETLDTDSINKLREGIPVKNISELYRILESFTT